VTAKEKPRRGDVGAREESQVTTCAGNKNDEWAIESGERQEAMVRRPSTHKTSAMA
jgi:hypothetical protein